MNSEDALKRGNADFAQEGDTGKKKQRLAGDDAADVAELSKLETLPQEMLEHVSQTLSTLDIRRLRQTSKTLRRLLTLENNKRIILDALKTNQDVDFKKALAENKLLDNTKFLVKLFAINVEKMKDLLPFLRVDNTEFIMQVYDKVKDNFGNKSALLRVIIDRPNLYKNIALMTHISNKSSFDANFILHKAITNHYENNYIPYNEDPGLMLVYFIVQEDSAKQQLGDGLKNDRFFIEKLYKIKPEIARDIAERNKIAIPDL